MEDLIKYVQSIKDKKESWEYIRERDFSDRFVTHHKGVTISFICNRPCGGDNTYYAYADLDQKSITLDGIDIGSIYHCLWEAYYKDKKEQDEQEEKAIRRRINDTFK